MVLKTWKQLDWSTANLNWFGLPDFFSTINSTPWIQNRQPKKRYPGPSSRHHSPIFGAKLPSLQGLCDEFWIPGCGYFPRHTTRNLTTFQQGIPIISYIQISSFATVTWLAGGFRCNSRYPLDFFGGPKKQLGSWFQRLLRFGLLINMIPSSKPTYPPGPSTLEDEFLFCPR